MAHASYGALGELTSVCTRQHSDYSQADKKGTLNIVFQTLKIGRMMRS